MSNLTKLEFVALDITGNNYLSWVLDVEINLDAKGLRETIKEGNEESTQDKAKAMIFLHHHLLEGLKTEYLTIKDPQILWANLKERYDHQKTVILSKARYEWLNLRLQDFKSVSDYNSAMFRITSQLNLCGEKITDAEMLGKTYSTFHANNVVLQTQYCEKGFQKYSELIYCLLVAEQNNELLMKNHELRPTGSGPFPEANVSLHNGQELKETHHANSSVRGHGRGREHRYGYGRGHWSRVCRTQKHLVDLYQQSIKQKGKKVETNLVYKDGEGHFDDGNATHLEVADFLSTPEGNY
ncbi:uncharacterized protein [Gossypium hirsutum]|uniref:Uncharacterized protein n=1 Tax=Gossypium hirsutum TaxID=3635 RepID=A0ABM3BLH7_GOSHI|nr:uncharacterized protein LOC121228935 [Gossypium hirsutum]